MDNDLTEADIANRQLMNRLAYMAGYILAAYPNIYSEALASYTEGTPLVDIYLVEDGYEDGYVYRGKYVIAAFSNEQDAINYANTAPLNYDFRSIRSIQVDTPESYPWLTSYRREREDTV